MSGGAGDDDADGYGVFGGVAADAWSLIVASCVLAASVVIWEACAIAAMAAALAAGAAWCLSVVGAGWSASRAGAEYSAAAPGGGGARGLAEVDIRALLRCCRCPRTTAAPGARRARCAWRRCAAARWCGACPGAGTCSTSAASTRGCTRK